jgi:hypothetical protein
MARSYLGIYYHRMMGLRTHHTAMLARFAVRSSNRQPASQFRQLLTVITAGNASPSCKAMEKGLQREMHPSLQLITASSNNPMLQDSGPLPEGLEKDVQGLQKFCASW